MTNGKSIIVYHFAIRVDRMSVQTPARPLKKDQQGCCQQKTKNKEHSYVPGASGVVAIDDLKVIDELRSDTL